MDEISCVASGSLSASSSTWLRMCSGSSCRSSAEVTEELVSAQVQSNTRRRPLADGRGVRHLPPSPTAVWGKRRGSLSSDIGPSAGLGWCDPRGDAARGAPRCRRSENSSATDRESENQAEGSNRIKFDLRPRNLSSPSSGSSSPS